MRRTTNARASGRARRAAARHSGRIYVSHDGTFAIGTFEPVEGTAYRRVATHKGTEILVDAQLPLPKRLHVGLSLLFGRLIVTTSFYDGDWELFDDTG